MNKFFALLLILFFAADFHAQSGIIKTYYPNGKERSRESYADDVLEGTSFYFYENGNLKKEITYSGGVVNGWVREFYENGLTKEEFYVDFGVRDGVDKIYYENGALKEVRYYKQGKLAKTIALDYDPTYVAPFSAYVGNNQQKLISRNDEIICDTEECPAPIGGIPAIQRKAKYTEHAKLYGLEGDVIVIATIDTSGNVIKTEVVKGLGLGLDEAAKKAIQQTKFFPGKENGKPVISHATIKVNFSLGKQKHVTVAKNEEKKEFKTFVEEELYGNDNVETIAKNSDKEEFPKKAAKTEEKKKDFLSNKVTKETRNEKRNEVVIVCPLKPCARPIGGTSAIKKNFKIPKRVKEAKIKGVIKIKALVDKYGKVRETEVLEGLPEGANEAAEVALYYTDFKPAIKNGLPTDSYIIVSIPVDY
jgi:TonB family protein